MAASVWKVEVAVGDVVQAGTPLMVLEAMKMEISVQAPTKGNRFQIEAILKEAGEKVDAGEALVIMSKVS
jgi:urea carboxylase